MSKISSDLVITALAQAMNVSESDLRDHEVLDQSVLSARAIAMLTMIRDDVCNLTVDNVGQVFGVNSDVVSSMIADMSAQLSKTPDLREGVNRLVNDIKTQARASPPAVAEETAVEAVSEEAADQPVEEAPEEEPEDEGEDSMSDTVLTVGSGKDKRQVFPDSRVSLDEIVTAATQAFDAVTADSIRSSGRGGFHFAARVRHICMALSCAICGDEGMPEFFNRNAKSMDVALRIALRKIREDKTFAADLYRVFAKLYEMLDLEIPSEAVTEKKSVKKKTAKKPPATEASVEEPAAPIATDRSLPIFDLETALAVIAMSKEDKLRYFERAWRARAMEIVELGCATIANLGAERPMTPEHFRKAVRVLVETFDQIMAMKK